MVRYHEVGRFVRQLWEALPSAAGPPDTPDPPLVLSEWTCCWDCGTLVSLRGSDCAESQWSCPVCQGGSRVHVPSLLPSTPLLPQYTEEPTVVPAVYVILRRLHAYPGPWCQRLAQLLSAWCRCLLTRPRRLTCYGLLISPPIFCDGRPVLLYAEGATAFQAEPYFVSDVVPMVRVFATDWCTTCGRPRVAQVIVVAAPRLGCHSPRAICTCLPPGAQPVDKQLAARTSLRAGIQLLEHVVPVSSRFLRSCAPVCEPAPPMPSWLRVLTRRLDRLDDRMHGTSTVHSAFRQATLNCGGAGDPAVLEAVTVLICALDPDVVCLQELWDADPRVQVALAPFVFVASSEAGRGRGMWVLVHRRLQLAGPPKVLFDSRSWMAVVCDFHDQESLLVFNLHPDPSLSQLEKELELAAVGTLFRKLSIRTVAAGDFNTPRTRAGLVTRMLEHEALSGLRVPYPAGTPTNHTVQCGKRRETEIDYILVSPDFSFLSHSAVPGPSSHACVVCDFEGVSGLQRLSAFKRYRHPASTNEQRNKLTPLLALFWFWLSAQDVHPDVWIRCYWLLADPVIPTHCTRQATAERMRLGAALRQGSSKELLDQWHQDLRSDMFMCGLRLNRQIVEASSVTRLTTKTMKLQPPCPRPLPELKLRPDHMASSVEEVIREARNQLEVYQGGRGVLMNLPDLTWAAATACPLPTPDEISFISLFRARRLGDWDADPEVRWHRMHARDSRAFNTVPALREALRAGGSDATSVDDLPLSLLRPFPYAGHVALWRYLNVLRTAPQALSNTAVQLGIEKKGHPWLFCSYRPIQLGSGVNRLEASTVHRETMYRADMAGDFDGRTFSYRKEISPQHMAFSVRASVVLGCVFAATGYNLLGTLRTRASQCGTEQWVVEHAGLIVLPSESVFSDDRRYVERDAPAISRKVTAAHHAAQQNCTVNNLAKQEYTVLRMCREGEIQRVKGELNIEGACTAASHAVPGVVGIAIQPGTYLPGLVPKLHSRIRRWRAFVLAHRPHFTLALRALYAYVLSSLDYVCRGSFLPASAIERLQPRLQSAVRALLCLPQDVPVTVLQVSTARFGWGCPSLRHRAALLFLYGYFTALDGRDSQTRTLLRAQRECPLPLGDDDASRVDALLPRYHLHTDSPSDFRDLPLPQLLPALVVAPKLFLTTDAGLAQSTVGGPLGAGMGVVISDGAGIQQEVSWGVLTVGASSTALEWMAKLLGVWICREAEGRIWVTADSAAALVCGFQRWVWVNPWFDRVAKVVLAHRVWHAVHEPWTPAQHDTKASGLLPGWQERSHHLATWGRDNPTSQGFPLTDALCLLRDVPSVLWHGQALVISYVSLFSELRDEAEWCDSGLSVQLAGSGFRSDVWCAVCDDSEVTLTHHRVAAYLRLLPSMPRTFFDVPSCRFCGLSEGNQWAHVQYCSVLYLRMGHALVALVEEVAQRVRVLSCDTTDLLARLKVPSGVLVVGVVPEQEVQPVSVWACSVLGASQVVLVSWTGLLQCACHLGHCGGAASTRCKYCTVMSCGARRQKQDRSTGTPVSCARVSEGTLRTGTSMPCMIQWLFTFPANSLYRSCSCFDECSMM